MYKNQIHYELNIAMTEGICQWFFVLTVGKKGMETPRLLLQEAGGVEESKPPGEWRSRSPF